MSQLAVIPVHIHIQKIGKFICCSVCYIEAKAKKPLVCSTFRIIEVNTVLCVNSKEGGGGR